MKEKKYLKAKILQEAYARGFIHQCTDKKQLDRILTEKSVKAYIGFDATAKSLHAGHLMAIMMLRMLQKYGHHIIIVIGGGTTQIGDPSGKDKTRTLQTKYSIAENSTNIEKILAQFLKKDQFQLVNNAEWLEPLNLIEFLRDIGQHFSVNKMLATESVTLRLEREQNLSFLEFSYMLCQAYDFLMLAKNYDCQLQIGGSDQWANIVAGIDLARRKLQKQLFGLTMPLLTNAEGQKMGKTAEGAIWLDAEKCSPWNYWQFWRNCHDNDTQRFLQLFTDIDLQTIAKLTQKKGEALNQAKTILAEHATALIHGQENAKKATQTAEKIFVKGHTSPDMPQYHIPKTIKGHIALIELLVATQLCHSKSQARKLIQQGGVKIDRQTITSEQDCLILDARKRVTLSKGKKHHILIHWEM